MQPRQDVPPLPGCHHHRESQLDASCQHQLAALGRRKEAAKVSLLPVGSPYSNLAWHLVSASDMLWVIPGAMIVDLTVQSHVLAPDFLKFLHSCYTRSSSAAVTMLNM